MHAPGWLDPGRQLPALTPVPDPVPAPRDLIIWGAHGGAGTSTLATLLQPARDMGALRSEADYRYPPSPGGNPVLVTCRCTTWSAITASKAVTALTRGGGQVSVLAVVNDGWPEPPIATAWFRLLSAQVGAVVRVPFIPWLRISNDPALVRLPRPARQALATIRSITDTHPDLGGGHHAAAYRGPESA
jgi:hypothetical protein